MSNLPREDVQYALELITKSNLFVRSKRIISLLRYIVEQTLAGDTDQLKGYSIGLDVFERSVNFDPDSDTIVRVEMGRLRKKLELYYLTEGKDAPVIITIPTGTYIPVFELREMKQTTDETERDCGSLSDQGSRIFTRHAVYIYMAGFVFLSAAIGLVFSNGYWWKKDGAQFAEALAMPNGPSIAVLKFRDLTGDQDSQSIAEGITVQLIAKLSRFRSLFVLAPDTSLQYQTLDEIGIRPNRKTLARYILTGTIQRSDFRIRVNVLLIDSTTKRILWSENFDQAFLPATILQLEDKVARSVASKLGQPEGVINKQISRDSKTANSVQLDSFRCILKFYWYLRHKNPENYQVVRDCLRISIQQATCYSDAWAAMSWIIADEQRLGFNPEKIQKSAFLRSLETAEKAVECDPQNATAQHYLAKAQFVVGKDKQALKSFLLALQLNPNDANLLANTGTSIALMGNWRTGILLMKKAITLNPSHPRWYFGILFLDAFRKNKIGKAVDFAQNYFRSNILLSHIYLIAALSEAGRASEAKQSMAQMALAFPDYDNQWKKQLDIWRVPADLAKRIRQSVGNVIISQSS